MEIFDQFPSLTTTDFFMNETLANLPNGTTFIFDDATDTFQFRLPPNFCEGNCSQNVVLINGTDAVDYMIQGEGALYGYLHLFKQSLILVST